MQNSRATNDGKPYTRVVRRNGRAVRLYIPAGPAADCLHAQADLERLERDGAALAYQELRAELEPGQAAGRAYAGGVADLLAAYMRSRGYHYSRRAWRRFQMSVELFTKLDGAEPHTAAAVDAVSDLGRDARAAWLTLVAGDDAGLRAAVTAELAAHRAGWATPADPPAVALLADLMALTWLEETYFSRQTARACQERVPEDQRQLYQDGAAAAGRRLAGQHRDLAAARRATVEWDRRLERLAELRRQAAGRKRAAKAKGRGTAG